MRRRKKIEKVYYAERNYYLCKQTKRYIKALYYYFKWKFWEIVK